MADAGTRPPPAEAALARDRAFRWFWVLYFLLNFGQGVFPPLLPEIMTGLGLTYATAGLLGTAFGVARFATDVPAGLLVERRGAAGVLHAGIGCLLAGTALSAVATRLPAILAARALVGVGSGMSIVISILFLMRRGPASQRTRRGNLYEVAVIGGTAASAWLGGALAARLGWRWGFALALAAIALGWGIAALRFVPLAGEALARPALAAAGPEAPGVGPWKPILAVYLATFSLAVAWAGGITTFLPLYGGQGLALSAATLGRALSVAYAIEAALLVPVGWAADRWGRGQTLVPGFLVMAVGVLGVPATRSPAAFGVAATLLVLGLTVWMVPPVLLAERLPGGFRGPAAGLYRFVSDLGYVAAPGATGWLIERRGFASAAVAMATLFAAAAVASLVVLGPAGARRAGRTA
jgi:MFS family permease